MCSWQSEFNRLVIFCLSHTCYAYIMYLWFILDWIHSRRTHWLLWLCRPPYGYWAEYTCCCVSEQLSDNPTDQHWPQIQVSVTDFRECHVITWRWHCWMILLNDCCGGFYTQGFHSVCQWNHHRSRQSSVALLLPMWYERCSGERSR